MKFAEFIVKVLRRRDQLAPSAGHVVPDMSALLADYDAFRRRALAVAGLGHTPTDRASLHGLESWFLEHSASKKYAEYEIHYATLTLIDCTVGHQETAYFEVGSDILLIGRSVWSDHPPTTHIIPGKNPYRPFRHLRLLPKDQLHLAHAPATIVDLTAVAQQVDGQFRLRLGLCALSEHPVTRFASTPEKSSGRVRFRAQPFTDAQLQDSLAMIDQAWRWAIDHDVNILCLPELCVCPSGRGHLQQRLKENSGRLALVIPGSFHETTPSTRWYNAAPVWLVNPRGTVFELGRARKSTRFETDVASYLRKYPHAPSGAKDDGLWAIANAGRQASLEILEEGIHLDLPFVALCALGLVGIGICKDHLEPEYRAKINRARLDYLFNVSMNSSDNAEFDTHGLARSGVLFAYINAAQACANGPALPAATWHIPRQKDPTVLPLSSLQAPGVYAGLYATCADFQLPKSGLPPRQL